jgi:hypothetical protein
VAKHDDDVDMLSLFVRSVDEPTDCGLLRYAQQELARMRRESGDTSQVGA